MGSRAFARGLALPKIILTIIVQKHYGANDQQVMHHRLILSPYNHHIWTPQMSKRSSGTNRPRPSKSLACTNTLKRSLTIFLYKGRVFYIQGLHKNSYYSNAETPKQCLHIQKDVALPPVLRVHTFCKVWDTIDMKRKCLMWNISYKEQIPYYKLRDLQMMTKHICME